MAVVAAATDAVVFGARQDQLIVRTGAECPWNRGEETRPAGAALVFHIRGKEGQVAADANEYTRPLFVVQRARAGGLGTFLAQHVELRRVQTLAPLFFRQFEWLGGRRQFGAVG